ncbi:hypothetical protein L228DRAFT_85986 [Xylona heveae TC161]|uniref:Uncharacterized protein n=1 Tax=Xylona heveae (strain CBS 132557 / TC161) TaxID=1328760 RepID=A0A165HVD2_XYLHT|nr:hypothetical protein L228DRAFT_85986 [Xylona heveae TC161]KZF23973.1 hypothetical protein L228DRAFT_85986 [Xylona heveae TC161]
MDVSRLLLASLLCILYPTQRRSLGLLPLLIAFLASLSGPILPFLSLIALYYPHLFIS